MTEQLTRPYIHDAYASLTQVDDELVLTHLHIEVDDAYEGWTTSDDSSAKDLHALVRVFEFIHLTRTGTSATEARDKVRGLTKAQLLEIFRAMAVTEDEVMPDEPSTESGKDDAESD